MVFKSLKSLTPDYLGSKFIALSNATSYTFRDSVNKLTLFLNNNEILGELSRENVISSHVKILPFAKSHNRTERDTQGVGRDILIPKKLFLELCGPCENSFR